MRALNWLDRLRNVVGSYPRMGSRRRSFSRTAKSSSAQTRLETLEDRALLATLVVTTPNDLISTTDAALSLREALLIANDDSGATSFHGISSSDTSDTITFAPELNGVPIVLTRTGQNENAGLTGDLDITSHVTIRGAGAGLTIIDGNGTDRVFDVRSGAGAVNVTLEGITIRNGLADVGGGILNSETLIIWDSVITQNKAVQNGGGLFNASGHVELFDTDVTHNEAGFEHFGSGGGIFTQLSEDLVVPAPTLLIAGGEISFNSADRGGGIFNDGDHVELDDVLVTENFAELDGGGIRTSGNLFGGMVFETLIVRHSEISHNEAGQTGGGIYVDNDTVLIFDSMISNNIASTGGGIVGNSFEFFDSPIEITIRHSTIDNNEATDGEGGGLLIVGLQTTLEEVTVSNNRAKFAGGGALFESGFVEILSSVFNDNVVEGEFGEDAEGGGIAIYEGTLSVERSTIVRNTARGDDQGGSANGGGVYQGFGGFVELFLTTVADNVAQGGSTDQFDGGDGYGGGLYSDSTVVVYASTFEGNEAIGGSSTLGAEGEGEGGGIWSSGFLEIENSTFSGNSATHDGGGIYVGGGLQSEILHATITLNRADSDGNGFGAGGGIALGDFGTALLTSSIISGNVSGSAAAETPDDVSGELQSNSSFNLIGDAATSGGLTDESSDPPHANIVGTAGTGTIALATVLNPMLADNGGVTETHALVAMSPAIDHGSEAADPRIDQRFFYRADEMPDAGAFEFGANSIVEIDELESGMIARVTLQFPDNSQQTLLLEGSHFYESAVLAALFEGTTEGVADDDDLNDLDEIDVELLELSLITPPSLPSQFAVSVGLNSMLRSLGQIEEQSNATPGTLDLPPFGNGLMATSFFDVFFDVSISSALFSNSGRNSVPLRLQGTVTEKPVGVGDVFQMVGDPIELRDDLDELLATIIDMQVIPRPLFDFGDAPNRSVDPTKSFPVTRLESGAHHVVDLAGPILGDHIDQEAEGQPSVGADGDDNHPMAGPDDEDGIHFTTSLVAGEMATVEVTVTKAGATNGEPAGFLNVAIDFNGNGSWDSFDEAIFVNEPVAVGVNALSFLVSESAIRQAASFARFRLTSYELPEFSAMYGVAYDGEVEDVAVAIDAPPRDFGDAPSPYPTVIGPFAQPAIHEINPSIRLGALIDAEDNGYDSIDANGDDSHGLDDEDGVAFITPLIVGQEASIEVTASAPGFLNAWIDFEGDGFWSGTWVGFGVDQIAYNLEFTAADFSDGMAGMLASVTKTITFDVPAAPFSGAATYARFRFSTEENVTPFGTVSDGEVEDYRVTIQSFDFGDAPDSYGTTLDFDETEREGPHHQRTGPSLSFSDAEIDGQPLGGANPGTGDDDNGFDDENGVFFGSFVQNGQAVVSVYPTAPGFLNAWFDFGADGSFDEPGDHIFNDVPVVASLNLLSFPVGSFGLEEGETITTFARFRIADDADDVNAPYGFADSGEVEDYGLIIEQPLLPDEQVGGTFIFSVLPGRRRGDPAIAIGYDYRITDEVEDGSGRITELLLPSLPGTDDKYTLHLPDGFGGFQTTVAAVLEAKMNYDLEADFIDADGNTFVGVPGGFASLRILGIETAAMLDVEDELAFVFDFEISGTEDVIYDIEMTAIPEAVFVDNAGTLAIDGSNMAGDFLITTDQGVIGTLDDGDIVTWFGVPGAEDDEPGLRFGTTAFATIQAAIDYVEMNDFSHLTETEQTTIRVAPGTFVENLVISGTEIVGSGAGLTVIDGNGNTHVIEVLEVATALVKGVTVQNGQAAEGGGIYNLGTLTIQDSTISGNVATSQGGGIFNSGTLTILNSTISNNQAGEFGGGVANSTIGEEDEAHLTIRGSTISGNMAMSGGGGISNTATTDGGFVFGETEILDGVIVLNSAPLGGGIFNFAADEDGTATAELRVLNSTISGNSATNHGGGLFNDRDQGEGSSFSEVMLVNVTITGNRADSDGMGDGEGGGIFNFVDVNMAVTLHNSIVAGNYRGSEEDEESDDISGESVNPLSSFNLIGDPVRCGGLFTGDGQNNIAGEGSPLGVIPIGKILDVNLADNGGPTWTHQLVYNSLAIDSGSDSVASDAGLMTDQRGLPRVMSGDGDFMTRVDRGAYERGFSVMMTFPLTAAELTLEILDPEDPPMTLIVLPDGPSAVVTEFYGPNAGDGRFNMAEGTDEVSIQLVQLHLTGGTPFGLGAVDLNPAKPSFGRMVESAPGMLPGVIEISPFGDGALVDSFFDVFFEITVQDIGLQAHNNTPVRVSAELTDLMPPPGVTFERPDVGDPIELFDVEEEDSGIRVRRVRHTPKPFDFGDAPDPTYPTLLASDGARHVPMGPRLGPSVDPDVDGMPTVDALGDDTLDFSDDENGVMFVASSLISSQTSSTTGSVSIDLQNADPFSNKLDAWIDFDQDGVWEPSEQIFTSFDLGTTDGVRVLMFTIPADSGTNVRLGGTYARFRLSTSGGLMPTGAARDGEVEDYRLTILEKNDFDPECIGGPFDLAENSPNNTIVGTVNASDDDETNGGFTFSIIGGNGLGIFAINTTTGEIRVQNNSNLDREAISSVVLTVQVSDNGPGDARTGTTEVTINVTPVNDNSPMFTSMSEVEVPENISTATVVLDVNATDADLPAQMVTYSLSGPDADQFNINASTGEITFVVSPDFETPTDVGGDNDYNVTVTATDNGSPTRSMMQDLTITVTDVAEDATLQRIVYRALSATSADVDFIDTLGGITTTPFRGVTIINLPETAPELVFELRDITDVATLMNWGRRNDGDMLLFGAAFPNVRFSVIGTMSLIVDGRGGNDVLSVLNLDSRFTADAALMINGGSGHDSINVGALSRAVWLAGGSGNDILIGGSGHDTLSGGLGDDLFNGGRGTNTLHESLDGTGVSNLVLQNFRLSGLGLDTLFFLQRALLEGSDGNNRLDASGFSRGPVTLLGRGGDDTLYGGTRNDSLDGGDDDDSLFGNRGNDQLDGGSGNDRLFGGVGNDRLNGGTDNDTLLGESGNDVLIGGAGDDGLSGGVGSDRLHGQSGNDTLLGDAGNDLLRGDSGDDICLGGTGNDTTDSGSGVDTINGGSGTTTYTPETLDDPDHDLESEIDNAFTFDFGTLL